MASIVDDRGYNQGYAPTQALAVRTERRCAAMLAEMPRAGDAACEILEVGCGTGALSALLAARTRGRVLGTDLCLPFIDEARARHQGEPRLGFEMLDLRDSGKLKEWTGRFDYVVGDGILHHLYGELDQTLRAIRALLKPGGRAVFWEPNLHNPYVLLFFSIGPLRRLVKLEPGEMAFGLELIRDKLRVAGFRDVKVECRDFLVPNTPAALIGTVVRVGGWLERVPGLSRMAQSLFISAAS